MSKVIFSFLTTSRDAINAFVSSAVDRMTDYSQESNYVKFDVYSESFNLEPRMKYTGFEKFFELDEAVRSMLKEYLFGRETQVEYEDFPPEDIQGVVQFREALVEQARTLKDKTNILYLSGGVDSEIVALSFMEAGVKFYPIIFSWIDNEGVNLNDFDTKYAVDFCEKNDLKPVYCVLNVEQFWQGLEILEYADKYLCSSPQILTYHKMVALMDAMIKSGEIDLSQY